MGETVLWNSSEETKVGNDLGEDRRGDPSAFVFLTAKKGMKNAGFGHNYHVWQNDGKISDSHEIFSKRL